MIHTIKSLCALIVLALAAAPAAAVTTILNTGGFESYADGNLVGQPNAGNAGSWREASSPGQGGFESQATVQSSIFHPFPPVTPSTPGKAVKVERKPQDDANWAVPVTGYPLVGQDLVVIEWDMLVNHVPMAEGFGPFFGVQAYDQLPLKLLGSAGVDAATGEILYQAAGTGVFAVSDAPGAYLTLDTFDDWHQFRIALDFTNNAYQVMFNGAVVVSEPFVDGPASGFTDADIAALASGGDMASQNASGAAYFDNFLVVSFERVPGDYDVDGDVDSNDYAVWRATYGGSPVAGTGADGNGDGVVDAADYTVWRDNVGAFAPALTAGGSAAPEPAAALLAACGLLGFGIRARN